MAMYQIHGISIPCNTTKVIYVAQALGVDYEYIPLDLTKGENKTPEHRNRHPLGKLPTMTYNGKTLFESNAICCYLASAENSTLCPNNDPYYRARIDQWLAFFTNHLGRWLTVYGFEKVTRGELGLGAPNEPAAAEAFKFIRLQLPCIDEHLSDKTYFLGEKLSVADYVAFAYLENTELTGFSLSDYPAVAAWYEDLRSSKAIQSAHQTMGMTITAGTDREAEYA